MGLLFADGFTAVLEGIPRQLAERVGHQLSFKLFARTRTRNGRALNQDPTVLRTAVEGYAAKKRPAWTL